MFNKRNSILTMLKSYIKKEVYGYCSSGNENQVILKNQFKIMDKLGILPNIEDVGFRVFSQFEEDGLLLYIFSLVGEGTKKVVEICCGTGDESMSANLIINHGWDGLLFDGSKKNIKKCKKFFSSHINTRLLCPPKIVCAWITKDNINSLIEENNIKGEIELLSLDIDGNDYYIMEAINVISPKVIICETHSFIPLEEAVSMPYKDQFCRENGDDFYGVSTAGMIKLLNKKGYRLIAMHRYGGNCIFMRNDIGQDRFPEIAPNKIVNTRYYKEFGKARWIRVKERGWIKV